jgi:hypothetical protein
VSSDQSPAGQHDGHGLGVERIIDAPGFSTTVEVTIEAGPDGHRLRLVQQGFPTVQARDDFAAAWPDVLGEVARRVMSPRP